MAMQGVHLCFGRGRIVDRVVGVDVEKGLVTRRTVREHIRSGEMLVGVVGHPAGGLTPEQADAIMQQRIEIADFFDIAGPFDLGLLFDPATGMVVMAGQVTVGQMRQFIEETGYTPTGHDVFRFEEQLKEQDHFAVMQFTSEVDCYAFAMWALTKAREQYPNLQELRLPTNMQWVAMWDKFAGRQTGELAERLDDGSVRSMKDGTHIDCCHIGYRVHGLAFRLVGTTIPCNRRVAIPVGIGIGGKSNTVAGVKVEIGTGVW